jgi:hypothetical protein
MADAPISYAIVIGIGALLAAVLFGARAQRLSHSHKAAVGGNVSHSEAA